MVSKKTIILPMMLTFERKQVSYEFTDKKLESYSKLS